MPDRIPQRDPQDWPDPPEVAADDGDVADLTELYRDCDEEPVGPGIGGDEPARFVAYLPFLAVLAAVVSVGVTTAFDALAGLVALAVTWLSRRHLPPEVSVAFVALSAGLTVRSPVGWVALGGAIALALLDRPRGAGRD